MAGWVRLLLVAGAVVYAGVARTVPTKSTDWALAGVILAAALVQAEVTRRTPASRAVMPTTWTMAAAVSVHPTLAIALVLVLHVYRCVRERQSDLLDTFGVGAAVVIVASLLADTPVYLPVVAALAVSQLGGALRGSREFVLLDAALVVTGAIIGALAPGDFLAVMVGIPVVVMLQGAAFIRQLEKDASVDQKTGLANASYWKSCAEAAFAEPGRSIGVLMIDLDHFKRLNDTHGHAAGDDVLAAVGKCLRTELRETDVAGRFGGEEFTVLLPDTDVIETMATAERLRAAIAAIHVTTANNQGQPVDITDVTASIGAAIHPHHGATAEECLRIADNHVYQAKQQGRNTVVGIGTENLTPFRTPHDR